MKEKKMYLISITLLILLQLSLFVVLTTTTNMSDNSSEQTIYYIKSLDINSIDKENMINVEIQKNSSFKMATYGLISLVSIIDVMAIITIGAYHNKAIKH